MSAHPLVKEQEAGPDGNVCHYCAAPIEPAETDPTRCARCGARLRLSPGSASEVEAPLPLHEVEARAPLHEVKSHLPWMSVGFLIAGAYMVFGFAVAMSDPWTLEEPPLFLRATALVGWVYWLGCVYRMHQVLAEATGGTHPIGPGRAVLLHFIPIYNLFWLFRWSGEVLEFVNARSDYRQFADFWAGLFLLCGLLVGRFFDAGLGLIMVFGVGAFLNRIIRKALVESPEAAI